MIGIYKITSPTGRIYIGQSINIEVRFSYYKRKCCKKQRRLHYSFEKYGVSAHSFSIVEECEIHELNIKERYYQDIYDCIGENGLNCVLTKTNDKSGCFSSETILRLSISHKGLPKKEESIIKMKKTIKRRNSTKKAKLKKQEVIERAKIRLKEKSEELKEIRRQNKIENKLNPKPKIKKPNMKIYLNKAKIENEKRLNDIREQLKSKKYITKETISECAFKSVYYY